MSHNIWYVVALKQFAPPLGVLPQSNRESQFVVLSYPPHLCVVAALKQFAPPLVEGCCTARPLIVCRRIRVVSVP